MIKLFGWIIAIILVASGGLFGRCIPFSEQWPLFEALRTTAAIIFAVVGAWFAIIYPERLKVSFKGGKDRSENSYGINRLFTPIVHSTIILSIILILGIVAPIFKRIDFFIQFIDIFRGTSYSLLVALTLWQLITVILSLIPADIIKQSVDKEVTTRKNISGYIMSQKKREKK